LRNCFLKKIPQKGTKFCDNLKYFSGVITIAKFWFGGGYYFFFKVSKYRTFTFLKKQ